MGVRGGGRSGRREAQAHRGDQPAPRERQVRRAGTREDPSLRTALSIHSTWSTGSHFGGSRYVANTSTAHFSTSQLGKVMFQVPAGHLPAGEHHRGARRQEGGGGSAHLGLGPRRLRLFVLSRPGIAGTSHRVSGRVSRPTRTCYSAFNFLALVRIWKRIARDKHVAGSPASVRRPHRGWHQGRCG